MTDERRPGPLFDGHSADEVEAERLDEALDALASGGVPDVDPREDPALSELVQTAAVLQHLLADATERPSFDSYRRRSRAAIIHRLERRVSGSVLPDRPELVEGRRRIRAVFASLFAPAAAAAAAAAITFMALAGGGLHAVTSGALVANQTPASIDASLTRLQSTLAQIASTASSGQPVDTNLLRQVTEDNAAVQQQIQKQPEKVNPNTVAQYAQAANQSKQVLSAAKAEPGGEGALSAAQITASQGVVTAAQYFEQHPDATASATPEATATATPAATETATPEATETPTSEATVTATAEASETATATPDVTATATPEATATATVTPGATATATPAASDATPAATSSPSSGTPAAPPPAGHDATIE